MEDLFCQGTVTQKRLAVNHLLAELTKELSGLEIGGSLIQNTVDSRTRSAGQRLRSQKIREEIASLLQLGRMLDSCVEDPDGTNRKSLVKHLEALEKYRIIVTSAINKDCIMQNVVQPGTEKRISPRERRDLEILRQLLNPCPSDPGFDDKKLTFYEYVRLASEQQSRLLFGQSIDFCGFIIASPRQFLDHIASENEILANGFPYCSRMLTSSLESSGVSSATSANRTSEHPGVVFPNRNIKSLVPESGQEEILSTYNPCVFMTSPLQLLPLPAGAESQEGNNGERDCEVFRLVMDTSSFLEKEGAEFLELLIRRRFRNMPSVIIVVAMKVFDELERISSRKNDCGRVTDSSVRSSKARSVLAEIRESQDQLLGCVQIEKYSEAGKKSGSIKEDLNNDDFIVLCAVYQSDKYPVDSVFMISNDRNLQTKAKKEGIKAFNARDLLVEAGKRENGKQSAFDSGSSTLVDTSTSVGYQDVSTPASVSRQNIPASTSGQAQTMQERCSDQSIKLQNCLGRMLFRLIKNSLEFLCSRPKYLEELRSLWPKMDGDFRRIVDWLVSSPRYSAVFDMKLSGAIQNSARILDASDPASNREIITEFRSILMFFRVSGTRMVRAEYLDLVEHWLNRLCFQVDRGFDPAENCKLDQLIILCEHELGAEAG